MFVNGVVRDEVEVEKAMSFVAQATGGLVHNELACRTRSRQSQYNSFGYGSESLIDIGGT